MNREERRAARVTCRPGAKKAPDIIIVAGRQTHTKQLVHAALARGNTRALLESMTMGALAGGAKVEDVVWMMASPDGPPPIAAPRAYLLELLASWGKPFVAEFATLSTAPTPPSGHVGVLLAHTSAEAQETHWYEVPFAPPNEGAA